MATFRIVRFFYREHPKEVVRTGLTLEEAISYLANPETASHTAKSNDAKYRTQLRGAWFDGMEEER
jgi:hypothetical protein